MNLKTYKIAYFMENFATFIVGIKKVINNFHKFCVYLQSAQNFLIFKIIISKITHTMGDFIIFKMRINMFCLYVKYTLKPLNCG